MTEQKISPELQSAYLQYLPAIFQQTDNPFIGRFLLAFEQILTGLAAERGLEGVIDTIYAYFKPGNTPPEFLPWLASWVAFSLREDWNEEERRNYLAEIVSLYRWRGTKDNLIRLLEIYTGLVEGGCILRVNDFTGQADTTLLVGRSYIGQDSQIGGNVPHHFNVTIYMPESYKPEDVWRQRDIASSLIELQKPAHTTYTLDIRYVTMRIDESLQIGRNTFLGSTTQYVTLRIDPSLRIGVNTFLGAIPILS